MESAAGGGLDVQLTNVNGKWLANMTKRIVANRGKFGFGSGKLPDGTNNGLGKSLYGTTLFGCQSHVGQALWGVGVPTLPINVVPQILWAQLVVRQVGIFAAPFLINR